MRDVQSVLKHQQCFAVC